MITKACGWFGMIVLLLGYYCISMEKISAKSRFYHGLNLLGSIGIIIDGSSAGVWSVVVLNIFWGIIAIKSIFNRG